jgi:hypothetical protein
MTRDYIKRGGELRKREQMEGLGANGRIVLQMIFKM